MNNAEFSSEIFCSSRWSSLAQYMQNDPEVKYPKKNLNNGQAQLEYLRVLHKIMVQMKPTNSQCLFTFHYTFKLNFHCISFIIVK